MFRSFLLFLLLVLVSLSPLSAEGYRVVDINEVLEEKGIDSRDTYESLLNDQGELAIRGDNHLYLYSEVEGLRKVGNIPPITAITHFSNNGVVAGLLETGEPFIYYPLRESVYMQQKSSSGVKIEIGGFVNLKEVIPDEYYAPYFFIETVDMSKSGTVLGRGYLNVDGIMTDVAFRYEPKDGLKLLGEKTWAKDINTFGQSLLFTDMTQDYHAIYLYDANGGAVFLDDYSRRYEDIQQIYLNDRGTVGISHTIPEKNTDDRFYHRTYVYFTKMGTGNVNSLYFPGKLVLGINDQDQLLFWYSNQLSIWTPNGKETLLPSLPGGYSFFTEQGGGEFLDTEINNRGQVAGYIHQDGDYDLTPFVWDEENGMRYLYSDLGFKYQNVEHGGIRLNDRGEILLRGWQKGGYVSLLLIPDES